MKKYFDFHCHPTLKQALTVPQEKLTGWDNVAIDQNGPGGLLLSMVKQVLPPIMDSQANLTMLSGDNYDEVMVIAVAHGFEQGFANNYFIGVKLHKLTPLDQSLLVKLKNHKISYYELLVRDFRFLLKSQKGPGNKSYQVVNSVDSTSGSRLCIGLSVEGGHCFKGIEDQQKEDDERTYDFFHDAVPDVNEINRYKTNFRLFRDELKKDEKGNSLPPEKQFRIIFMTITHLTAQRTATHCYGTRVRAGGVGITALGESRRFFPHGHGISEIGKALIWECYSPGRPEDKGMECLVDIKHMSIQSRIEFYSLRKQIMDVRGMSKLPIIASHMGVTGVALWDRNKAKGNIKIHRTAEIKQGKFIQVDLYKRKGLKNTHFYPWSIGLYDEEIEDILASDGMIGVSLDTRIVGAEMVYNEIFSHWEFDDLLRYKFIDQWSSGVPEEEKMFWDGLDQQVAEVDDFHVSLLGQATVVEFLNTKKAGLDTHVDHVANNILHIVKVGRAAGFTGDPARNVWDYLCIGSDLDGIADPIHRKNHSGGNGFDSPMFQHTGATYDILEQELTESIIDLLRWDKGVNHADVIGKYGIKLNALLDIDEDDIKAKVRRIMYDNGVGFIRKFFNNEFFR